MQSKFEWKFSWILVAVLEETKHKKSYQNKLFKMKNYYLLGGHPLHITSKKSYKSKKYDLYQKNLI